MLILGSNLLNTAVMSLRSGTLIARLDSPIIDPDSLKIIAYRVSGSVLQSPTFLRIADIREIGRLGVIVDDTDELISTGDVIKIDELYSLGFSTKNLKILDENGRKLGKLSDYSVDTVSFAIQKLHATRGLLHKLGDVEFIIDRSQIIEVNDQEIIVKSAAEKIVDTKQVSPTHMNYINPFRKPATQPEASPSSSN